MRRTSVTGFLATAAVVAAVVAAMTAWDGEQNGAAAWLCLKKGEVVSGVNRICIYHCPTGDAAITVSVASICPISIDR